MAAIYLIRHGQASFGAADYDQLSETGYAQAETLGRYLGRHFDSAPRVITGTLRRQQQTAATALNTAGWDAPTHTDARWNEFDSRPLLAGVPASQLKKLHSYRVALESGMRRWATEPAQAEDFRTFTERTRCALEDAAAQPGPVVVFSSGGVISQLATQLLQAGTETWIRTCRVKVNTGITPVVAGESGLNLVSFNEHAHLPSSLITYH